VTVTFLRGGRDHITFARATISRLGRRVANVDVMAWQDDEAKPIATAQMNVMLARGDQGTG
jgi:acyl-coenzyme A thioesterase PaaI-like protein